MSDVRKAVQEKYGAIAASVRAGSGGCCGSGGCGGGDPITSNLYSADEAGHVPEEAMLASLGCGNPTALADLQPGGSGIRAKLHGPDKKFADFLIDRDPINPRVIQAAGMDSPGLTSCLAVGARVAALWSVGR